MSKSQFTLYSTVVGPNVGCSMDANATVEEKLTQKQLEEQKAPEFTKLNPNGRIPAIIDHSNNDFVLWESNAIIEYILAKYDTEHKLSYSDFNSQQYLRQWLYFQASGQGPYYGQAVWFIKVQGGKPEECVERYQAETRRVLQVLNGVLAEREWLVGDHISAADVAFLQWNTSADRIILGPEYIDKEAPHVRRWMNAMIARPGIKKVLDERVQKLSG
ncbi:unnamed protein product [Clonostachys byssicola]|uniref:Glutathione S-transferase n=1 Tax=Clonostachys byssicola TaxID=160290 RepID=A0A9N9U3D4_9HYPO|nr:unnamed protein product [Clonostachys byssicola]